MAPIALPKYDNPPVDEVVFGVTFEPLHQFKTPYIGLFWEKIRKEFPQCEQAPVLGNFDEVIDPDIGLPTPRIWLINRGGDHLVQIQKNKLLFNWRRRNEQYPSFTPVHEGFIAKFDSFKEFISDHGLGDVKIKGYDLTYINIILQGEAWESLDSIGQLFPDLSWRHKSRFLSGMDDIVWRLVFPLPEDKGNILLLLQKGYRKSDNLPLLRFEITTNGFNNDPSPQGMNEWFQLAHEWIVRSFEDVTDDGVQREVWKKKV